MADRSFKRKHPGIGSSRMLDLDTNESRAGFSADKIIYSCIGDVQWACHRQKLVAEALRGLQELGAVAADESGAAMRNQDLAALHGVFAEFSMILCAEIDKALVSMSAAQSGRPPA